MEKDVTQTNYLKKSTRIADLLNGYYFKGARVIHPEDVKREDGKIIFSKKGKRDSELIERYQDLVLDLLCGGTKLCGSGYGFTFSGIYGWTIRRTA